MKAQHAGPCVTRLRSPCWKRAGSIGRDGIFSEAVGGATIQAYQELPSPFFVLSTTRMTMTGIRQMGVITRAKTMTGGGSLSSSVGQSSKNMEWTATKVCSTRWLGHGIRRQSDISSVHRLKLLYAPLTLFQMHQSVLFSDPIASSKGLQHNRNRLDRHSIVGPLKYSSQTMQ